MRRGAPIAWHALKSAARGLIVGLLAEASKYQECSLCALGARDPLPPEPRKVAKATHPSRFGAEGFVFLGPRNHAPSHQPIFSRSTARTSRKPSDDGSQRSTGRSTRCARPIGAGTTSHLAPLC